MKVSQIIGADLSKKTIDFYCQLNQRHLVIPNCPAGFKELLKWLKQLKINCSEIMIVMEHTGLYGYVFEEFLHAKGIAFTKVAALQIQRSIGVVRGKTDKIDARRIAEYGTVHHSKLPRCTETTAALK